jgi:arabinoxylan arabinofuranohydrolase
MFMGKKICMRHIIAAVCSFMLILGTSCERNGESMETKETNSAQTSSESSSDTIAKKFEGLKLSEPAKKDGENNPLITQDYGADPFAMEYNGRIYVYMTQDVYMYDGSGKLKENTYGAIDSLRCISSADMANWTDHGQIHVGGLKGVTKWARNSWAPAAVWKKINGKDRFFLYFGNSGGGIGVLSSDSPTGPFTDPIGKALITSQTPNCSGVLWMFDPAVLIDDDGKAYMYFGGGVPQGKEEHPMTARVIELGEDMISTVGEAVTIDAPFMFEDSGINKIGNTYYYSYCSNFSSRDGAKGPNIPEAGEIIYMTSSSPKGPWEYKGSILKNPGYFFGTGGNNHHCIAKFADKYYIFYHASLLQDALGVKGGYRSTNANEIIVNSDGSLEPVKADKKGVAQIKYLNPYEEIPAATMSNNAGIKAIEKDKKSSGDPQIISVGDIDSGDWIKVSGVDFGSNGAKNLIMKFASESSGAVKVCLDNPNGESIAYGNIPASGGYQSPIDIDVPVKNATGVHDIYFVFSGSGYRFRSWKFEAK